MNNDVNISVLIVCSVLVVSKKKKSLFDQDLCLLLVLNAVILAFKMYLCAPMSSDLTTSGAPEGPASDP